MPIFQLKQSLVDPVDLHGVIKIQIGNSDNAFISTYLTRLDQALLTWGMATGVIFLVAQFNLLDWSTQAILWSVLSGIVILLSGRLTWFWVTTRNQRWIFYSWSLLVIVGLGLTDYGIWNGWSLILRYLCPLWLGISAIGYVITGIGIKAPALMLIGIIHACTIPGLIALPLHQFWLTGLVMSASLIFLAAFQWEHQ